MQNVATVLFPNRAPDGRSLADFQGGLRFDLMTAFDLVQVEPAGAFRDDATGLDYGNDSLRFHVAAAEWTERRRDILDRIAGDWARRARIACAFVTHANGDSEWVRTARPPVTHAGDLADLWDEVA